jgi:hypothetical protein
MKLKNIFLTFILGSIWGFSSCSSEELVDVPGNDEIALSFSLAVNDIKTKGESSIATAEELQINNCHIAVFDNDKAKNTYGNLLTSFDFPGEDGTMPEPEGNVYTLLSAKTIRTFGESKSVKFLAIANIDGTTNKSSVAFASENCDTYSEYLAAVVTSESLSDNNLVKVGELEATLTNGATNLEINIPLTQLTARIDFLGVFEEGKVETKANTPEIRGEFLSEEELKLLPKIKSCLKAKERNGPDSPFSDEIGSQAEWFTDNGTYGFGFNKSIGGTFQSRFVAVRFTKTENSSSSGEFQIERIDGFNKQSAIAIWKTDEIQNREYQEMNEPNQSNIFYTYEVENTKNKSLTVSRKKSSSSETLVAYGFIRQDREWEGLGGWSEFSPKPKTYYSNMVIYGLSGERGESGSFDYLVWEKTKDMVKSSNVDDESYTLDLTNYSFVKGNRYKIQGKYTPKVGVGITWEVVGITPQDPIDIPPFN